jgi:hypothetical protein
MHSQDTIRLKCRSIRTAANSISYTSISRMSQSNKCISTNSTFAPLLCNLLNRACSLVPSLLPYRQLSRLTAAFLHNLELLEAHLMLAHRPRCQLVMPST